MSLVSTTSALDLPRQLALADLVHLSVFAVVVVDHLHRDLRGQVVEAVDQLHLVEGEDIPP